MQFRSSLVLLQYLVNGRNALTMASRDITFACEAGVSESSVVKDIDQEQLNKVGAGVMIKMRMLNITNSV